jgi:hypothetical protein
MLVTLLVVATLAACSSSPTPARPAATPSGFAQRMQALDDREVEAWSVVELFGSRLYNVSLQSLSAARQIRTQYTGLVSPSLLRRWEADPLAAPGRQVSSPWPDRIEISKLTFHGSSKCSVSGCVVMMSSAEIANGGSAALVPVRLQLRRIDGRWLITDLREAVPDGTT